MQLSARLNTLFIIALTTGCVSAPAIPYSTENPLLTQWAHHPSTRVSKKSPLSCDEAVLAALDWPTIEALRQAEMTQAEAVSRTHTRTGAAELRLQDDVSDPGEFRAALRWRPPMPAMASLDGRASVVGLRIAQSSHTLRRVALATQVRRLHLAFRMGNLVLLERKAKLNALKAHIRFDDMAITSGTAPRILAEKNRVRVHQLTFAVQSAQDQLRIAQDHFEAVVGARPVGGACTLVGPPNRPERHPEVVLAMETANRLALSAQTAATANGFWPTFIQASWRRRDEGETDQYLVELGLPLLSDTSTKIGRLRANVSAAKAHVEWVINEVNTRIRMARSTVTRLRERYRTASIEAGRVRARLSESVNLTSSAEGADIQYILETCQHDLQRLALSLEGAEIDLRAAFALP
jgi:hypothetical protein